MSGMDVKDGRLVLLGANDGNAMDSVHAGEIAAMARELLAHRRAAQAAPAPSEPVTLTYTNWQGKTAQRTINPVRVWFGSTPWHPEPQWLLTAVDAEKGLERDFALKDFGTPAPSDALREENARLRYVLDGVRVAISTGRNEPLMVWLDQINIALFTPTEERQ